MADDINKNIPGARTSTATGAGANASYLSGAIDPADPWKDTKEEMRQRFELLPEEVQKVLQDDSYQRELFEISKELKMTYEEMGILEVETTMVLLGMTRPETYRDELQLQLKKNDEEVDTLVGAVNERVFRPIRGLLEKIYAPIKDPSDYLAEDPNAKEEDNEESVTAIPQPTSLSKEEETVLEKTGVVLSDTPVIAVKPLVQDSNLPSRKDLLNDIENPPKSPMSNIVADKLTTAGPSMQPKTTDYSLPKVAPAQEQGGAAPRSTDPYREAVG